MWNEVEDTWEFENDSRIRKNVLPEIKQTISDLIQANWDCFSERGTRRPIIGYKFWIDTGDSKHVCCSQPRYGVRESKVIVTQIEILFHNSHIMYCKKHYGARIILTTKLHQETVENVKDFSWRICDSYRIFNAVTRPFQFQIGQWNDELDDIGDNYGQIWLSSLGT